MNNCDKCFKKVKETDNIFEDSNGNYICQDCFESKIIFKGRDNHKRKVEEIP